VAWAILSFAVEFFAKTQSRQKRRQSKQLRIKLGLGRNANFNWRIWAIIALTLAMCTRAHAADYSAWNNRDLVKLYSFYDLLCRGLDDEDAIDEGCQDRRELVEVLLARGYCYVGGDYNSTRWKKGLASPWRKRGERAHCR
jgi:hypothetical protein